MIEKPTESELEAVKKISREYSADVIKSMVEITLNKKYPPSTRVQAAQIVLDRAFGKPKVHDKKGGLVMIKAYTILMVGILLGMSLSSWLELLWK